VIANSGSGTRARALADVGWRANMAMDPLHRIGCGERQRARKHLVQRDAQRVEIAAAIHRTIHAAGLFGRHIGERAGNNFRRHCVTGAHAAFGTQCRIR